MTVLVSYLTAFAGFSVNADKFGREVHAAPACKQSSIVTILQDSERRIVVAPHVRGRDSADISVNVSLENALDTFCKSIEIDAAGILIPERTGRIVFEISRQVTDVADRTVSEISSHKPYLVSLISVAGHAQPYDGLSVRTPERIGIISAAHRNHLAFTCSGIVDVNLGIRAECIFLSRFLLA